MASVRTEASSPTFHYSYHVFLSFRGKDTRKTFTDHLYTALMHVGIRTFKDDDELDRGENISLELEKAIEESKISIIVFSENYASSSWCLDELVKILERKNTVGQIVLPIFYYVKPSQVRKQMGSFAKAFAGYEEKIKAQTNERKMDATAKVERWKEALREAADLSGMVLKDAYESQFIQDIVIVVSKKLSSTRLSVAPYIIGIDSQVENICVWLQDRSADTNILAICGMGGIGKTTIAKFVYNLHFEQFEGSSFLANIREVSAQPNGLVRLQRQLLSDILKRKSDKIWSIDEGIIKIKDSICCKRVLIVLDDVDQVELLDAVLGIRDWFHRESKIIITTRKKQLLKANEVYKVHEVEKMNLEESFKLFNWHAFGQDHPFEGYSEQSKRVALYCGGIPLALQVVGSSLSGRTIDIWESALEKLEAIPDNQILKKLKISYDCLQDGHDKNLFLDIACFFAGKNKDFITIILDGCGFHTKFGIQNLIDRFLLTISRDNKVQMHQLLQDMAREIVHQESSDQPGKRSRLWHHKDVFNILTEKTGTETIEGLILNVPVSKEDKPTQSASDFKRKNSEDFDKTTALFGGNPSKRHRLGFFSWLSIYSALTRSFSKSDEAHIQIAAFSRMHKLRLLQLYNIPLTGDYAEFPKKLVWLFWRGFPLRSIPNDFPLESLVVLDMPYSSLEQVWKRTKLLRLLKILNLSHSHCLTKTPDFTTVPNLERVILKGCINLVEIHESIVELTRLVILNLKDCKNIRQLPQKIGQLKFLQKLNLSGCSKLIVPQADGINQSLSSTAEVKAWHAVWPWVSKPTKSPEFSFSSLPQSLTELSLQRCNICDHIFPKDLSSLSLLRRLDLRENPICTLPESMQGLTNLQSLNLELCQNLQSLPELPRSLEFSDMGEWVSLEHITTVPNRFCAGLITGGCDNLVMFHGVFKLEPIGNVCKEMLENFGLVELEFLENLQVKLLNRMACLTKYYPPQGLYEGGIFSIFLPGSEVPDWFRNNKDAKFSVSLLGGIEPFIETCWCWYSAVSFTVPSSLPNLQIRGLNVCVVYSRGELPEPGSCCVAPIYRIVMSNITKVVRWTYSPTMIGDPDDHHRNMIWLSHWKIGSRLEVGDEMTVWVFHRKENLMTVEIQLVYNDEEEEQDQEEEKGGNSIYLSEYEASHFMQYAFRIPM